MPNYTTRLGLTKPSDGENYDVDVVNANSDIVDSAIGARTVTSTTRPSTPYVGQIIYETDTKVVRMWNGTNWTRIGGDPVAARISKVDGFQQLPTASGEHQVILDLPNGVYSGGFSAPATTTSDLVIPETGYYKISGTKYQSGANCYMTLGLRSWAPGQAPTPLPLFVSLVQGERPDKTGSWDMQQYSAIDQVRMVAGTRLQFFARRENGDTTSAIWGGGNYVGTTIAIELQRASL